MQTAEQAAQIQLLQNDVHALQRNADAASVQTAEENSVASAQLAQLTDDMAALQKKFDNTVREKDLQIQELILHPISTAKDMEAKILDLERDLVSKAKELEQQSTTTQTLGAEHAATKEQAANAEQARQIAVAELDTVKAELEKALQDADRTTSTLQRRGETVKVGVWVTAMILYVIEFQLNAL